MQLPGDMAVEWLAAGFTPAGRTLAVAFTGSPTHAWTAVSDRPWLVLTTAAGSGNGDIVFTIEAAALPALDNFSSDTAHVTVTPAGLASASIAVTLTKKFPEISSITPYVLRAGAASSLHVRGRGLLQLENVSALRVESTHLEFPGPGMAGVTGSIISDNEIQLSLPALTSGNYGVTIKALGDMPAPAHQVFSAVTVTPFAPQLLAAPAGDRTMVMYHPSTAALFVVEKNTGTLERYFITSSGLILNRSLVLAPGSAVGMSLNGLTLYTTTGTTGIEERKPATLALIAGYAGTIPVNNGVLQITDDNRIWWNETLTYFDSAKKHFATAPDTANAGRHYAASSGARMFTVRSASASDASFARYEPNSGTFQQFNNSVILGPNNVALSADGKWVVSNRHVVYNALDIQAGSSGSTDSANEQQFLSSEGSRLYIPESALSPTRLVRIKVFDAHTGIQIGEIPLPNGIATCDAQCNYRGNLAISPFDNAFFWAGNGGIAIIPIPTLLQPQP